MQGSQNFPQSPMDVPASPQHFRFPDQYGPGPRSMMQRSMVSGPVNGSYHPDQMGMGTNQQQLNNSTELQSPQGMRGTPMDSSGLPSAQSNLQQYNHVDQ